MKPQTPDEAAAAADLRRRAEERLQTQALAPTAMQTAVDAQALLHALQVHQIELELQNEELRRARSETDAALERFKDFHDFSPVGFFTLARDGTITQVNLTGARLFGLERGRLIHQRFSAYVADHQQLQVFNAVLQSVFSGGTRQSRELDLVISGQLPRTVEISATLSPDRQECRAIVVDITERRHVMRMLEESSQFNKQVIEVSQEGIIVYGPDLRYRVWNEYMENFTGMRATEVLGRHPTEVFPFLEGSGVLANLERSLAGGEPVSVEFQFDVPQSGRSGWALDRNSPLRNARGEIVGVIGNVSDITRQKQAQQELDAAFRFSRSLIDSMQDGFSVVDPLGVHVDVNPALCRMTGYLREELIGTGMPHRYWPPEDHIVIHAAFARILIGDFRELELRFMRRNGERFPVLVTPAEVRDAAGKLTSYTATVKDITERRRTEAALNEAQQRFREIVNATDGIVWEADAETFVATFVSQQAERLLGYPVKDWRQPEFLMTHVHADDRAWVSEYVASSARLLKPFEVEYRLIAQDGRTVWLHDVITVVAENGVPRWLRGITVDVTRRRHVEERLVELAENLETKVIERTTELRRIAAQLSLTEQRERRMLAQDLHDNLGQLLAVIKIKLTSMSADPPPPEIATVIDLVTQADRAARNITQELSPPILQRLGLMPALDWLSEEVKQIYGLAVHVDSDPCARRLDDEIQAVLYRSARELLINVAKHAGVKDASLTCLCDHGQLLVVVSDAGSGFDPASRLDKWDGRHSFGLRSIHERITNLGGSVEIDSSPGSGTTVTISVPRFIGGKEICDDPDNACR